MYQRIDTLNRIDIISIDSCCRIGDVSQAPVLSVEPQPVRTTGMFQVDRADR